MSEITVSVGGYAPVGSTHSQALDHFRDRFLAEVDGAADVDVDLVYNIMDQGRPATDLFALVEKGDLTWCYYSTAYLGDDVPVLNALEIPYLFDSLADAHRALDGPFGKRLGEEITAALGYEVLGFWDNGFRHLTNRERSIRQPADASGLTIRLQPNAIHKELVAAWGMKPVTAELSEGIRMIAEGAVEAQENPLANSVAYGVNHRYFTLTGHLYGARGLYANVDTMAALPTDIAEACRRAARSAIGFQRRVAEKYERELHNRLVAEGREVIVLSDAENEEFKIVAGRVIERARDRAGSEILDLIPAA
jgi:TRAP-type C4-dicarboxylate transport system substrate-binding protein